MRESDDGGGEGRRGGPDAGSSHSLVADLQKHEDQLLWEERHLARHPLSTRKQEYTSREEQVRKNCCLLTSGTKYADREGGREKEQCPLPLPPRGGKMEGRRKEVARGGSVACPRAA